MYTPNIQKPTILSVGQITKYIKSVIEGDPRLMTVFLTGEISNLRSFSPDKHNYFTLKDNEAVISATMFMGYSRNLRFRPTEGMKVICRGGIELYAPQGKYQIIIEDMQPDGIGALNLAYEQLKKELEAKGLFDEFHKKPIPKFPKTIGVITSPTGAALQDIKNILHRRFPCVDIILSPVLVQGPNAAPQLVNAVRELDESGLCDTIIIGRGGGSIEDLWPFNDERLAYEIYNCHTPIISAVGHQTDFTICDFVSDLRAPTPSAAAEIAVPDRAELMNGYNAALRALNASVKQKYDMFSKRNTNFQRIIDSLSPENTIARYESEIKLYKTQLENSIQSKLNKSESEIKAFASKLESLNPLSILSRGYSVAEKDGKVISSKTQLSEGDCFTLTLSDGKITAIAAGE